MARMVKKLSGLEIDEVSLVDRPANQHGLVAIAKRQEDGMSIFDAQGNEVDEAELEHGDVVYGEDGTELVFVEGDAEDGEDFEDDDEGVEKGLRDQLARRAVRHTTVAREVSGASSRYLPGERMGAARSRALRAGIQARGAVRNAREEAGAYGREGRERLNRVGRRARNSATAAGMQYRAIPEGGRKGIRYGGAAAAGAGGGAYADNRFGKSLGESVLEDLSKALTEDARDEVIAKALDHFESVAKRNEELEDMVLGLVEAQEAGEFTELAKGYELGDPEEVGGLLYRASQVLPAEDVAALDRVFSGYGEIAKYAMDEIGYNGGIESDIVAQVYAIAGEAVGKSAGALSQEQAVTALFEANPAAYDEYEAEQRRR